MGSTTLIGIFGVIVGVILSNTAAQISSKPSEGESEFKISRTALRAEIRRHRERLLLLSGNGSVACRRGQRSIESLHAFRSPKKHPLSYFRQSSVTVHILPYRNHRPGNTTITDRSRRVAEFAEDLASERYLSLEPARKAEMYKDYLAMAVYALQLGQ